MRADGDSHSRRTRVVLIVSNAMLVLAALIVTSPWTSGLYTWVEQRRLSAEVPPAPTQTPVRPAAGSTSNASPPAWQLDDAHDWRFAAEGTVVGRLSIAKLGLDEAVVKGVRDADLRKGPGWVPATSAPGRGNCGIAGHRTTYLAPFRGIDRLAPGDTITLVTRRGTYTYRVVRRFFVARDDADILFPTRDPTLTLTSCHPPYSAQFRIAVQALLVKAERR